MAQQPQIKREWLEKDYYKDLGVSKKADAATIKKTYRKLARELHPDTNPDKKAEEKFKAVSEAYDVLGDAETRKQYDEARELYGSGGPGAFFGGGGGGGGARNFTTGQTFNPSDLGDLFGGLFNRGGGGGRARQQAPRRGADVESEVTLSFNDALNGVTLPLRLSTEGVCQTCGGSGAKPGGSPKNCPSCGGSGVTVHNQGGFAFSEPCPVCHGHGIAIDDQCPSCHGSGQGMNTRTVNARVPAGVRDGQKIRLKGKGSPGERGGASGDLLLLVHVTPDPIFGRDGNNVTVTVPVAFDDVALGSEVKVPTPGGSSVRLRVPAGTSNGRTFRVKGRGVQGMNGKPDGDLLATVVVTVPAELTDDERAAIEAFRAARSSGG